LALGDYPSSDCQKNGESEEDGPAIFLQSVGGVDGSAEATAGAIVASLSGLLFWLGSGGAFFWRFDYGACAQYGEA
jgi:hypothetical protein